MFYFSYRARLIVYSLLLMAFLSGTLIYSYRYMQDVILTEADNHLLRMKQLLNVHLNGERNELQRYAAIFAQDLRLKEYMFVVTGIGCESTPLETLYKREFGWLPIDRMVIIGNDGRILVGKNHVDLAIAAQSHTRGKEEELFYFYGKTGLEVVAVTPIRYRDEILGHVAVSNYLNQAWIDKNKKITESEFFLFKDGHLTISTLNNLSDSQFDFDNHRLVTGNQNYRIYQIDLPGNNRDLPTLWFGLSESVITAKIDKHRQYMLTLVGVGIIGLLLMGLVIIRNFSRPLEKLIKATRQVAKGEIPLLAKNKVTNEFDELSNHFVDMLQALRDQQKEIERTHEQLEQTAITDSLTGLYNRHHLKEVFPKLLAQAQREDIMVFVILLDIDFFKKINDTYGHIAGDHCLISFAERISHESRTSDYLFRIGGEEFMLLFTQNNIMDALNYAEKLRLTVERNPVHFYEHLIPMTMSVGVSYALPGNNPTDVLESMLTRADSALYKAKNEGRNRTCLADTPEDTPAEKLQMQ